MRASGAARPPCRCRCSRSTARATRSCAYRGLRAFVDTWARRDRCAPRPTARREVEGITHLRWHGCAAGTRVEHLRVADDTHGWPSITDANQRMVRFLRAVG